MKPTMFSLQPKRDKFFICVKLLNFEQPEAWVHGHKVNGDSFVRLLK